MLQNVMTEKDIEPPDSVCMMCSEICDTWEHVDIGMGEHELWCYCEKCDVETFHKLPLKYRYN